MIKFVFPVLLIFIPLFCSGQTPLSADREQLGLLQPDSNWTLTDLNYIDTMGRIITDTSAYQVAYIIEHWETQKYDSLKLNKVIQSFFVSGKMIHEADIYKKYLPEELMIVIQLNYNYSRNSFSATLDTTLTDEKFAQNRARLEEIKGTQNESDYYGCGTAYRKQLYRGYKPTIPVAITEEKARQHIIWWMGRK
ncbi:MAG: hypothetical protein KKA07_13295 [Bacteroidetes bacterium]|nr:hypothetical protein [Bacteroidota bacterium]MBU1720035.1 hypothetical protein [Bacteroidota bacterium]